MSPLDLGRILEIVISSVATIGISGSVAYFLREAIKSWLWKEHSKEIEKFKSELQSTTEKLKFELQRSADRAQLFSSSIYSIYPEIYKEIKLTTGLIEGLYGMKFPLSFEHWNSSDFIDYLTKQNLPAGAVDLLIIKLERDRPSGLAEIKSTLRSVEFHLAYKSTVELQNLLLLKELLISRAVKNQCWKINTHIRAAYANAETCRNDPYGEWLTKVNEELAIVQSLTTLLLEEMHKELNP